MSQSGSDESDPYALIHARLLSEHYSDSDGDVSTAISKLVNLVLHGDMPTTRTPQNVTYARERVNYSDFDQRNTEIQPIELSGATVVFSVDFTGSFVTTTMVDPPDAVQGQTEGPSGPQLAPSIENAARIEVEFRMSVTLSIADIDGEAAYVVRPFGESHPDNASA